MPLATLNRFDDKTANAILAAAALSSTSASQDSVAQGLYQNEINELLREVRKQANIAQDDQSQAARAKVGEVLFKEVRSALLGEADVRQVKTDLGTLGQLPLSSYKIRFSAEMIKTTKESEKYLRRVIRSPNDIQHVSFEKGPLPQQVKGMSLIVIEQLSKGKLHHWILVDAMRFGAELYVSDVHRVFPQVVNLDHVNTPLEMLRAFVSHYGVMFSIEGGIPSVMFEQVSFPKDESELSYSILGGTGEHALSVTGNGVQLDPSKIPAGMPSMWSFIVAAYCVDVSRYLADKRKYSNFS